MLLQEDNISSTLTEYGSYIVRNKGYFKVLLTNYSGKDIMELYSFEGDQEPS